MAAAAAFLLRRPSSILLSSRTFATDASSSARTTTRHYPPPPPHEYLEPSKFLGSWRTPADPRRAEAKLARLRRDYALQVKQLRREYAYEVELMKQEKQRRDDARREAARVASDERKAAKAAAAQTSAAERKIFQDELRKTLLNERAKKLESWRAKEQLREKNKTEKKELLRQQSSLWIDEKNLEKMASDATLGSTPF